MPGCLRSGNDVGHGGWVSLGVWLAGATRLTSLNGFDRLAELRAGGVVDLDASGKEGLPMGLAAAGLLGPSAATLTSVNFR